MAKWDVGDVVECVGVMHLVLAIDDETKQVRVAKLDGSDVHRRHEVNCRPVSFPIPAEKDPWKTSEPRDRDVICGASRMRPDGLMAGCNRSPGHAGHHVARGSGDVVLARWKNDSAEVKAKIGGPLSHQTMCVHGAHVDDCTPCTGMRMQYERAQRDASNSPCARDAACGECAKLKRELENESRANAGFRRDALANVVRLETELKEERVEVAFLKRELERLRKRKP